MADKKKNPNTTYISKPHTGKSHSDVRIDLYHHGADGKKEGATHGVKASKGVIETLLKLFSRPVDKD